MKVKAIRALIYAEVKVEDDTATLMNVGEKLGINNLERLGTAINKALNTAMSEIEKMWGNRNPFQ